MRIDRCPTCKRRMTRSTEANRRLWAIYHLVAERIHPRGIAYSADQWHLFFKSKFLGCTDVHIPNNRILVIPNSTANLDTPAFNNYMTQVEAWANERSVYLEDDERVT